MAPKLFVGTAVCSTALFFYLREHHMSDIEQFMEDWRWRKLKEYSWNFVRDGFRRVFRLDQ